MSVLRPGDGLLLVNELDFGIKRVGRGLGLVSNIRRSVSAVRNLPRSIARPLVGERVEPIRPPNTRKINRISVSNRLEG